jgi:hypothetical protein
MRRTPWVWKADDAFNNAFSAQIANVTYHVASRKYGHLAYIEVPDGDLKKVVVGNFVKLEQAQRACERHYAAGCDLSKAR